MAVQGGYFFMVNTIKNVKITITAMYSTQTPPFIRESKQPPPFPYQVIIAKYFNIFNITNLKSQYILLLNHTTSIWHIFIVARAELWVSGVTPAQQAESTLISAFGKSAFRINAFDTTQISVQSPTSSIFSKQNLSQ